MNYKKVLIVTILGISLSLPTFAASTKGLEQAIDHIEQRVERFGLIGVESKLNEFRDRIAHAQNKREIQEIAKDLRAYHKDIQKGKVHDLLVASVAHKIQNHAVEVMQKRSDGIAEHLAKLEAQGKNTDEAEAILQNANAKIVALEGDTVQEVQAGIQEIYKLFASIAKAVK